jgi:hypothetical protein
MQQQLSQFQSRAYDDMLEETYRVDKLKDLEYKHNAFVDRNKRKIEYLSNQLDDLRKEESEIKKRMKSFEENQASYKRLLGRKDLKEQNRVKFETAFRKDEEDKARIGLNQRDINETERELFDVKLQLDKENQKYIRKRTELEYSTRNAQYDLRHQDDFNTFYPDYTGEGKRRGPKKGRGVAKVLRNAIRKPLGIKNPSENDPSINLFPTYDLSKYDLNIKRK